MWQRRDVPVARPWEERLVGYRVRTLVYFRRVVTTGRPEWTRLGWKAHLESASDGPSEFLLAQD
jgi:hypothetical protein